MSLKKLQKVAGRAAFIFTAVAGAAAASTASAAEAVQARDLPPELRQLVEAITSQPRVSPGVAFGSPIGFGASTGDYFFGLNGSTADETADELFGIDADGSLAFGMGIGDPVNAIGLELAVNIVSLQDAFGDDGAVAFKLHRNIGERGALAIGTENTIAWGDVEEFADNSTTTEYISYSHYFQLNPSDPMNPGGLMVTFGVGDGRLGQMDDPKDYAPFVSVGYNITRQMSVIADYAGEAANVGLSVVPWRDKPFSIVLGATDVTEERGNTEFAFGIGYSGHY